MAIQETIIIGALPNDGTGDPLRTAFRKINDNFTSLFATDFTTVDVRTIGNTPNQTIFEAPVASFTQGQFQINSTNPSNFATQNITLSASLKHGGLGVSFTGYGTLFDGDPICTYDMDVHAGNVRILCSPLTSAIVSHYISYQITQATPLPGLVFAVAGYPAGSYFTTESGEVLTTEP
jgi:hypothetical protein